MMPWGEEEYRRLIERLPGIRPPQETRYRLNGRAIPREPEIASRSLILPTVLQNAPGEPLRSTRRRTEIHILLPREEGGRLHEMGIPVQHINLPYDVDVMQKGMSGNFTQPDVPRNGART